MSNHLEELNKAIQSRRSIRPAKFTGETISDQQVLECLEAANWAPTHGHTEPWRFKVFGPAARTRFYEEHLQAVLSIKPDLPQVKKDKMRSNALNSSHIIVIIAQLKTLDKIPDIEEIEAVSCAVQNLHLYASSAGLGGFWSTGGVTHYPEAQDWLELEENQKMMGFFFIGVPEGEAPQSKRGAVQDKIQWITQ